MSYSHSSGYLPEPQKITPTQAHIVAKRFANKSRAIAEYARKRSATLEEQLVLLVAIARLVNSTPRGKGHCLDRAALINLGHHIANSTPTKANLKQKDYANV